MKPSTKPYKIGLVLDDSLDRNDGVQQYVRTLGCWLNAQGHTVHYLVGETQATDTHIHSLSRNVHVRFNGNTLSVPLPVSRQRIRDLLAREQYDVLHIQMPYHPFLGGKILTYATPHTALVATFHIMPMGKLQHHGSRMLSSFQRKSLRKLDAVASVSPVAQAFAASAFGVDSTVIPNMIDTSQWQTDVSPTPGKIVFLGRLVPRKGCQKFLNALSLLPSSLRAKTTVVIAGTGPERSGLEAFARKQQLHNVQFAGYIEEAEKPALLASAELAVFPSTGGESFGIVLIEAMAAGAGVVIGGDNPGYASVLGPDSRALVSPQDAGVFAEVLKQFLLNKSLRTEVHAQQRTLVKQYDTSVVGPKILELYAHATMLHQTQNVRQ